MPELPEVEVILAQLRNQMLGKAIKDIQVGRDDIVRQGLPTLPWYIDSSIRDIERKGKCLAFTCAKNQETRHFVAELGMTGLFLFDSAINGYEKHLHVKITMSDSHPTNVYYWNSRRFGRVYFLSSQSLRQFVHRRFGIDPFSINEEAFCSLVKKSRGQVKRLLMDQHKIVGIGNIYANEILFKAGVHPHARGTRLARKTVVRLYSALQETLHRATKLGGSTIRDFRAPDGSLGKFQYHHAVYDKANRPCPRGCPTPIRRHLAERSSFFCPTCQKRK